MFRKHTSLTGEHRLLLHTVEGPHGAEVQKDPLEKRAEDLRTRVEDIYFRAMRIQGMWLSEAKASGGDTSGIEQTIAKFNEFRQNSWQFTSKENLKQFRDSESQLERQMQEREQQIFSLDGTLSRMEWQAGLRTRTAQGTEGDRRSLLERYGEFTALNQRLHGLTDRAAAVENRLMADPARASQLEAFRKGFFVSMDSVKWDAVRLQNGGSVGAFFAERTHTTDLLEQFIGQYEQGVGIKPAERAEPAPAAEKPADAADAQWKGIVEKVQSSVGDVRTAMQSGNTKTDVEWRVSNLNNAARYYFGAQQGDLTTKVAQAQRFSGEMQQLQKDNKLPITITFDEKNNTFSVEDAFVRRSPPPAEAANIRVSPPDKSKKPPEAYGRPLPAEEPAAAPSQSVRRPAETPLQNPEQISPIRLEERRALQELVNTFAGREGSSLGEIEKLARGGNFMACLALGNFNSDERVHKYDAAMFWYNCALFLQHSEGERSQLVSDMKRIQPFLTMPNLPPPASVFLEEAKTPSPLDPKYKPQFIYDWFPNDIRNRISSGEVVQVPVKKEGYSYSFRVANNTYLFKTDDPVDPLRCHTAEWKDVADASRSYLLVGGQLKPAMLNPNGTFTVDGKQYDGEGKEIGQAAEPGSSPAERTAPKPEARPEGKGLNAKDTEEVFEAVQGKLRELGAKLPGVLSGQGIQAANALVEEFNSSSLGPLKERVREMFQEAYEGKRNPEARIHTYLRRLGWMQRDNKICDAPMQASDGSFYRLQYSLKHNRMILAPEKPIAGA